MKLRTVNLKNFRRLESVDISFEEDETVFVGPNNSGKTSATTAFRLFLGRQDFRVYDFAASKIRDLHVFGADAEDVTEVPSIEMDLWFTFDPDVEYGRVSALVRNILDNFESVGIGLRYCVKDADKLKAEYLAMYPRQESGQSQKSLYHFLSLQGNLSRHFGLRYYSLERTDESNTEFEIEPEEGKRVIQSLLRIDFVDAQRNIDDQEAARSNRLSSAFAAFYKKNLDQAKSNEEANQVIDANNDSLTLHYKEHFEELMQVIKELGVPSINDRHLKIVSSLTADDALRGNTQLLYVDPTFDHELPEAYNGLGFKNLVYIAIQVSHFHIQWMRTTENRPLCQLIFIEEPEVHLHAQVQQAFVDNIWQILRKASKAAGEKDLVPQVVLTSHSSHILNTIEFAKVRYFRRCELANEDPSTVTTLNASKVHSLRDFRPNKTSANGEVEKEQETFDFLKKFLTLTHCDVFFADAVVMVEGTAEKILLPRMIEKSAPKLRQKYLTVLEVGGAYASRFASLFEFLRVPYLVIADIDSVDPKNNRKACRADQPGAVTSNSSLEFYLGKNLISELVSLVEDDRILADGDCFVSYQMPISVDGLNKAGMMHGRTFEDAFVYQNMQLFRDGAIQLASRFDSGADFDKQYEQIYNRIRSSTFKKTNFALDIVSSTAEWQTPQYISDGLQWLEKKLEIESDKTALKL